MAGRRVLAVMDEAGPGFLRPRGHQHHYGLIVQVKGGQAPVGDTVISQLLGTTTKHGPTAQPLLVAGGGVKPPALSSGRDNHFRLRVWTASDVIAQVARYYDELPEGIRTDLALKQIWMAVEEQG